MTHRTQPAPSTAGSPSPQPTPVGRPIDPQGERHRGCLAAAHGCARGLRVFVVVDGLVTYDDATRNATNIVESSGLFRSNHHPPSRSAALWRLRRSALPHHLSPVPNCANAPRRCSPTNHGGVDVEATNVDRHRRANQLPPASRHQPAVIRVASAHADATSRADPGSHQRGTRRCGR